MNSGDPNLSLLIASALLAGKRLFLTGAAGTGKTFLTKTIVSDVLTMMECRPTVPDDIVVVTATTGIAATHMFLELANVNPARLAGPMTLHSAACLPWHPEEADTLRRIDWGKANLRNARVIVVDEVSMLHRVTFEQFMERIPEKCGVLVVGDFFQLEPVDKSKPRNPPYCFLPRAFSEFKIIELDKNHRQDELKFLEFLAHLRKGMLDRDFLSTLRSDFDSNFPIIFGTNKEREGHNKERLASLFTPSIFSEAVIEKGDSKKAEKWFREHCRTTLELELKEGMRVLCIQNQKLGGKYVVNGDVGTLRFIGEKDKQGCIKQITIDFDRIGLGRLEVPPYAFEKRRLIDGVEDVEFRVRQLPFVAAYALTVHKAQGMTLDTVTIDGARIGFAFGQVYVALSRCKTRDGLRLRNGGGLRAKACHLVEEYYRTAERFHIPEQPPITVETKLAVIEARPKETEPFPVQESKSAATDTSNRIAFIFALIYFGAGLIFVAFALMNSR